MNAAQFSPQHQLEMHRCPKFPPKNRFGSVQLSLPFQERNAFSGVMASFRFMARNACLLFCVLSVSAADADWLFTLKVKPLLMEKCHGCHSESGKKIKGGLDLTSRIGFLKGGEFRSNVLAPGSTSESFILKAVRWEDPECEMPPKENDRLSDRQIQDLSDWIAAGAPWPSKSEQQQIRLAERKIKRTADGVLVTTSGGLSDEWTYRRYQEENLWAFQSVVKPDFPKLQNSGFSVKNPVDVFISARLDQSGFQPAPQADPITLLRRAFYDLIGLPPTPRQITEFSAAWEREPEKAWTELIDRLLASEHYGERWAQHWLDTVRYADTGGYSNDYERSNAWRYRDYVIRSLNTDKPYDQFVIEQLAGDEIAAEMERDDANPSTPSLTLCSGGREVEASSLNLDPSELIVATGFLRMGPWDDAMVKAPEARQIYIDDLVNSVGQTFLSTTLRCVKCHDHKFDPIPTQDYYRFYATFAATQMAERPAPFSESENKAAFDEDRKVVERLLAFATERKNAIKDKQEAAARDWFKVHNLKYVPAQERKNLPDDAKPPRHVGLNYVDEGRLKVREQDEWIWRRRLERFEPIAQSIYNGPDPRKGNARKLRIDPKADADWRPNSRILSGGSLQAPGDTVTPGVLSLLKVPVRGSSEHDPYTIPDALNGRRLALAKWIADPRNPLTVRSIVNRIWQHHFGKPLAGNPNNFGAKGAKPTHPKLLDWLADDFMKTGWRMKRLHRLIMLSKTYRQSGWNPQQNQLRTEDPNNELFAISTPRRLSAEELRDSMLAITGELNRTMGGLPAMPEINMEVALQPRMIQFSIAPAYQPSRTPKQRNRRTIYAYRVRGQADPFLELFNQPNPNDSCESRDSASVSPQALTLMNSDTVTDRSIALALRLEEEKNSLELQITRGFQLALGRTPDSGEHERMVHYVREMRVYHENNPPKAKSLPTRITRSLVEEFSGRPFNYEEILPIFESYTPDKKASDVNAHTRALADYCLLLFNANEFVYVY